MQETSVKIKAVFILLCFLGVQLISIACSIGNFAHDLSHTQNSTETHKHHQHEHANENDGNAESNEDEKCCVENSSLFLSGVEAISANTQLTLPFITMHLNLFIGAVNISKSLFESTLKQIRPPPLIGLNSTAYRIVIQSLLV